MKRFIIIWLLCGLFNWSATLGDFGTKYPPTRKHYGIALMMATTGILGVIPIIAGSNFVEHGFKIK